MTVKSIQKKVLSSDNIHTLAGRVFVPEGEIKGIFHVVHGMTEHIRRYEAFMCDMAEDGYVVFGYDHLGHGCTVNNDGELGYIAHKDGWKRLVDDVAVFGGAIKKDYGEELPYILLGHSMGSFIVRLAAEQYDIQDQLIIMGTGGPNPASGAGIAIIKAMKKIKGERYISGLIQKLAFGSYNKRFGNDNPYNWLSNIEKVRTDYAADPLCTFQFTVSAMEDLLHLNRESNTKRWFASCVTKKPVLLVSGADDPVGDYGKGIKTVYNNLKANGANVKMKLYDSCRHEILNDNCRNEVIDDIRKFLSYRS